MFDRICKPAIDGNGFGGRITMMERKASKIIFAAMQAFFLLDFFEKLLFILCCYSGHSCLGYMAMNKRVAVLA